MPYGIPNFAASLRDTVARQRRPRREVDPADFELPDSPAMDDYMRHAESTPNYEDYKPGFGGKVAGGLVAIAESLNRGAGAGVAAGREVMDRGYVNALREHARQGSVLQQRAGFESDRNRDVLGMRKERRLAEQSNDEIALREEANDIADRAEARLHENMTRSDENADLDRAARVREGEQDRASRLQTAGVAASASRYGSDRQLEGEKYRADAGFGRGPGAEKVIPIGQQGDADRIAIENVLRYNPKWMSYVDEIAGKEDSDFKGYRIVPGSKMPEDSWLPFGLGSNERDMTPDEKKDYDAFVRAVEDEKKKMYGTMVDPYSNRKGFGSGAR